MDNQEHVYTIIGIGVPWGKYNIALKSKKFFSDIIEKHRNGDEQEFRKMREEFFNGRESYNLNNKFTGF